MTGTLLVFDHLLAVLKVFVAAYGILPLSALLPDMCTDMATYMHLQMLYKAQANAKRKEL
jgi:hypothetical protein